MPPGSANTRRIQKPFDLGPNVASENRTASTGVIDAGTNSRRPLTIERRDLLKAIVAGSATIAIGRARAAPASVVVQTTHGRIRGLRDSAVVVFKGIPYAASTAGLNRFLPPKPLSPWAGVRDALSYGPSAPQALQPSPERAAFAATEPLSEDCLSLNIFAPERRVGARLPVMVWLHGGGWFTGAGSAPGVRGEKLAELGDVVVVTVNHRLNAFGYLLIEDKDERFADAANCGVLDMVAALRWVRQNAAEFGGDSNNVTIFGQSGGGAKVSALMATPSAQGLFHKAIAMSCSGSVRILTREDAAAKTQSLATRLDLARATGVALQAVPMQRLIEAARGPFMPILDGRTFTRHPFDPDAPPISLNIPLMAGNVATETRGRIYAASASNFTLGAAEVRGRIARFLRIEETRARRIVDAYQTADPTAMPGDVLASVTSDYIYVRNTRREATLQALGARTPVYSYLFTRRTAVNGGVLHATHESEVAFVFGTTEAAAHMVGDGPDVAPLTKIMIATWSTFARTGNPNNAALPEWPRHDGRENYSMLLDVRSEVSRDPGGQARASLAGLPWYEYSMPANYLQARAVSGA